MISTPTRIFLHLILLTCLPGFVWANDDPCSATALTVGTSYSAYTATNSGATNSTVTAATCDGGASDGDVWFSATVGQNGTIVIETRPGTLTDVGMAIYTGSACSSLVFNSCTAGGTPGFANMPYKSLSGLNAGSKVWVRIWDVGNDEIGTFEISAYVSCNASVSITGPASACGTTSSQLCATGGFLNYNWTGGLGSTCINVNSTGTYTVTVTDNDGCTASNTHSYTALSLPDATVTGPSSGCSADLPQICVASGASSYLWSTGGTTNCITPTSTSGYSVTVTAANGCTAVGAKLFTVHTSPSIAVTGPAAKCIGGSEELCVPNGYASYSWSNASTVACINPQTTGSYTATVTDNNGCTGSASKSITVNPLPTPSITGPSNACPGTNPQLCVSGSYAAYSWGVGSTTNCINPPVSGSYSVTVTDNNGCMASTSHSLTYYAPVSVAITGPSSTCTGVSAQICATGGFTTYDWSTGSSSTCINPTVTDNYTVEVTDANGCTGSTSHSFTVHALPSSTITGPASVCNGATTQLCAPAGNTSYLWSNLGTNSCITTGNSGTYSVTVTDMNGCTSSSSHSLTIYPDFAITVSGPSTACSGSNPQLCATNGSYTYQWSTGSTSRCISPNNSGTYTVTVTNTNGCTKSASKGLTVYSPLNANISGPSSACTGSVVTLCATAGSSSYVWSTAETTSCIDVNSSGTYTCTISDANGCSATASKTVTFSSSINVNITGPASGCTGSSATLCVPSGYSSYAWSTGATTDCITVNSAGNYSVTVHDAVGCVANSFYNLPFNNPPAVSINGPSVICDGNLATWCATPGFNDYQWSNGGNGDCIVISSDTTYSVVITDINGCTASTAADLTVIAITPSIIESGGLLICDTVNPNYTYEWLLNGLATGCSGDTCQPTFSGTYTVIVTDTIYGCISSATYNYISTGLPAFRQNDYDIVLYPNPVDGNEFYVMVSGLASDKVIIDVLDAVGKQVYSGDYRPESDNDIHKIAMPERMAGIYFVRIQTKNGLIVRRISAN